MKSARLTAMLTTFGAALGVTSCLLDTHPSTSLGTDGNGGGSAKSGGPSVLPTAGAAATSPPEQAGGASGGGGSTPPDEPPVTAGAPSGGTGPMPPDKPVTAGAAGVANEGWAGAPGSGVVDQINGNGFALEDSFFLVPCRESPDISVCRTRVGTCPAGGSVVEESFQIGGELGKLYDIRLQINGVVEGKIYVGGKRRNGDNTDDLEILTDLPSAGADTFHAGGTPLQNNRYSVYKISVLAPDGSSELGHYFLNSVPSSNEQTHTAFPISYPATLRVPGQGLLKYTQTAPMCEVFNNCGPGDNGPANCGYSRSIPTEPDQKLPAQYAGESLASWNILSAGSTDQPYRQQLIHVTVTGVREAR